MMINRLELIEKLKAKIQDREKHAVDSFHQANHKANVDQANYVTETAEAWSAFATTIRRRVRQNQPVTMEDVPAELKTRNYGDYTIRVFKPSEVKQSAHQPRVEALRSLLLVLESSPDRLISTSALERLGSPVRELFR